MRQPLYHPVTKEPLGNVPDGLQKARNTPSPEPALFLHTAALGLGQWLTSHYRARCCWTPLDQHTGSAKRAQFSIGTSAVKRSRLRREYWHLAQDAATFGDLWNMLAGRPQVKGQKVKMFRYQLANLRSLPAGADMRKVEASHLCGNSACFAPGHIAWEAHHSNTSRDWCHADGAVPCEHVPACIRGPVSRTVLVPGERRRGGRRRADAASSVAPSSVPPPSPDILVAASSTFPTPPVTPPLTLSNQLPSLAGPSRSAVRRSSSSSSSSRSPSVSTSSSHYSRASRASSELSVVPDSEDEDAWEAFENQEDEVEEVEVELAQPLSNKRRRSVEVLDLTESDDEDVEVMRAEDGGTDRSSERPDGPRRDGHDEVQQRRKRLFDLVSAELATLERPQKRQRHLLSVIAPQIGMVRLFRAYRPLTSWIQAIKARWGRIQ